MSLRITAPLLLAVALSACASVRTVDVAPTPEAVAAFVGAELGEPAPRLVATLSPDSVRALWVAGDPLRQAGRNVAELRRAVGPLESATTYEVGNVLLDVFAYGDDRAAEQAWRGLTVGFGNEPLQSSAGTRATYYVRGPLVVRVVRPFSAPPPTRRLDDGLGRPRVDQGPVVRRLYEADRRPGDATVR